MDELIKDFEYSVSINKDVEQCIKGAWENLDPKKVYSLFSRIRDEDIMLFDMDPSLCRPLDLLITQLPAPPVPIRPSVAVSMNVTNEDDLTVKMAEIIEINKLIKVSI